jgi:hypothetical protein
MYDIIHANIARFTALLKTETDPKKREMITLLLRETEAKLLMPDENDNVVWL